MALLFFKKTKDSVNRYKLKYNISFIGSVRLDRFCPFPVLSSHSLYSFLCPFSSKGTCFGNCESLEPEGIQRSFHPTLSLNNENNLCNIKEQGNLPNPTGSPVSILFWHHGLEAAKD